MFTSFIANEDTFIKPVNSLKNINFNGAETPIPCFNENTVTDTDETMKIYLRFRPLSSHQQESSFSISDHCSIIANPPEQSATYKNLLHGYGKGYQKFSFSKVFIPDSNQDFIFNETAKLLLNDFAHGNDRLLFTYGTTSSGKTFTMNGSKSNIGIIPRSLCSLFKSTKLNNDPTLMPIDFAEVLEIKKQDSQKLMKDKSILLKMSEKESSDVLQIFNDEDFLDNQNVQSEFIDLNDSNRNYKTTFWISYTEIYNELIYDLLDPASIASLNNTNINKLKRPILDIRTARNGGSYVKGLKSYPVFSAEEAYRLLLVGRRSQTMGATKLNQNSSRSHTIFTIRAVRTTPGSEYLSRVCNFSFCDLAGSERTDKAQTTGMLQKEASNINSSLLALGRCIDVLKHNQTNPNNLRVVPYRDSKLTRLFQTYLGGNGKAAMIVCINQDPILFDESLQVLKFSALAKKVVMHEKEKPAPIALGKCVSGQRLSLYRRLGMNTPRSAAAQQQDEMHSLINDVDEDDLDETLENVSEEEYEEEYDAQELLNIIESLKTELIAARKAKVVDEAKLREQLNREYVETIMSMERDHLRNMQALRDSNHEQIKKRARSERNRAFRQLKKRKIQPEFEEYDDMNNSSSEENPNIISLENENEELNNKLKECQEEAVESKETIEILLQEKEQLEVRCRTMEFQLQINSKPKTVQTKAASVQTESFDDAIDPSISEDSIIEIDCSTSSNLDQLNEPLTIPNIEKQFNKSKKNRFSPVSANPDMYEEIESINYSQLPQRFFEPLSLLEKKGKSPASPCTVKKNLKVNRIIEEENEDSFLKLEKECTIDDLQNQLSTLEIEVGNKSSKIHQLENQLEVMEKKLSSRENSIERYIEKEKDTGKRLNSLLGQLKMPADNEVGKIKRKLKILTKAIQNIQSGFREIHLAIPSNLSSKLVLNDSTNIENHDHNIDANFIVAHIKQLDHQLQSAREDYQQIISICNECIVDQASSALEIELERLTIDTCLSDISQLFQTIWNCAAAKLESVTLSAGDFNQQARESDYSQEMNSGASDGSQMYNDGEVASQSQNSRRQKRNNRK